jgi:hypothetical protein
MDENESVESVVRRAFFAGDPADDDILRLYLHLPVVVEIDASPKKVRSSFEAVFADAHTASRAGSVRLGAIGYLCFFDQLGSAVRRTDQNPESSNTLEMALELFTDLSESDRAVLYALRCSLAHDFSRCNMAEQARLSRRPLLRHQFELWPARQRNQLVSCVRGSSSIS